MTNPSNKRRSARLRKKLHIGEFQEFGFEFEADIDESFSPEQIAIACDAFLDEIVEPRGLGMGGWLNGAYFQSMEHGSATDDDREAVRIWLEARPEVKAVRVGPLSDGWYPPNDDRV
jgi:uncharacterized protein YggL (DUF469 family)